MEIPTVEEIRDQIPACMHYCYLNTAATSPLPRFVIDSVRAFMEDRATHAEVKFDDWIEAVDEVRKTTAKVIGAQGSSQIAFGKSTGEGVNLVAQMIPWEPGDSIVTTDLEFASNVLPWQMLLRRNVHVRVARSEGGKISPDGIKSLCDDSTRLLALSYVEYGSGFRHDITDIGSFAHSEGILFFLDAIQGLGAVKIDVEKAHVDFLSSGGHKWTMSPFGVSVFYVRNPLQFDPPLVGWFSLQDYSDYSVKGPIKFADSARRFEIGNLNFGGIMGMGASLEFLRKHYDQIDKMVLSRSKQLIDLCNEQGIPVQTPFEERNRAGIVLVVAKDSEKIVQNLTSKGIIVSARSGGIRISPHFWNTSEELSACIHGIKSLI